MAALKREVDGGRTKTLSSNFWPRSSEIITEGVQKKKWSKVLGFLHTHRWQLLKVHTSAISRKAELGWEPSETRGEFVKTEISHVISRIKRYTDAYHTHLSIFHLMFLCICFHCWFAYGYTKVIALFAIYSKLYKSNNLKIYFDKQNVKKQFE